MGKAAFALAGIALLATGCGEAGVAEGATVSIYVEAPLCAGAKKELLVHEGEAGKLRVRVVCVASVERSGRVDLATAGANARRASEDTSSVAFVSSSSPAVVNASQPILESVGIPQLSTRSGSLEMAKLLAAIRNAGDVSNLRQALGDALRVR